MWVWLMSYLSRYSYHVSFSYFKFITGCSKCIWRITSKMLCHQVEQTNEIVPVYALDAEFTRPLWVFGISTYDFLGGSNHIILTYRCWISELLFTSVDIFERYINYSHAGSGEGHILVCLIVIQALFHCLTSLSLIYLMWYVAKSLPFRLKCEIYMFHLWYILACHLLCLSGCCCWLLLYWRCFCKHSTVNC
jgi:hypothetical protein